MGCQLPKDGSKDGAMGFLGRADPPKGGTSLATSLANPVLWLGLQYIHAQQHLEIQSH